MRTKYFLCFFLFTVFFSHPLLAQPGVVLTFDDQHNIANWLKVLPLFEKYNAKATLFINNPQDLSSESTENLKKMSDAGFAIGVHGVHHVKTVDYIASNGIENFLNDEVLPAQEALENKGFITNAFAYPMSQNDEQSDSALRTCFSHARSGSSIPEGKVLADCDIFFTPVDQIPNRFTLVGKGCDGADQDFLRREIFPALQRAKDKNEILTLYSHNITENAKSHFIKPIILEEILKKAKELNLKFYTYDDLSVWKTSDSFRIVSFNIRACRGKDENDGLNPELAGRLLQFVKPDVAGIQEVDQNNERSQGEDQIEILGRMTSMESAFGKSIDFGGGAYGIGALSVKTPLSVKSIPLPGKEEARSLLELEFPEFVFFNTHLSLTAESRRESVKIIDAETKNFEKPVILAGDMNLESDEEWNQLFGDIWTTLSPDEPTWPSDHPVNHLDYIMVTDPTGKVPANSSGWKESVTNSGVINSRSSDHRPIFVDLGKGTFSK